jgi:hypothetical protein
MHFKNFTRRTSSVGVLVSRLSCNTTYSNPNKFTFLSSLPSPVRSGPERIWNNFDFWIVILCWVPIKGQVSFVRLLRLLRLLKLVGKVKQLQIVVIGVIRGLTSVSYILLLLYLVTYLFAIVCVQFFRKNDPFHFGIYSISYRLLK